jgi:glutamyl-Q tRNA(Asp) synthetase
MAPRPGSYRGRFAPSPTGDLHMGSLTTALGSWLLARQSGGQWLVRIEDIDPQREVAGAANRQLEALIAFGLVPDETVVRQSERSAMYQDALDRLLADGLAFTCHCSRRDLRSNHGIHRLCIATTTRPDPAIRLRVADTAVITFDDELQGRQVQDVSREVGDFVLKRADGHWAYQLAVVVDDALQGITHVARGADLLESTPRQVLLQRALGLPTPRYAHLPLVVDNQGRKLSKSCAAMPVDPGQPLPALLAAWQALGQPPAALADAGSVGELLTRAVAAFQPTLVPRMSRQEISATKNSDFTKGT